MHRWARSTHVLLIIATLAAPTFSQPASLPSAPSQVLPNPLLSDDTKSNADKEKEALARRQAALTLLDLVLAGSKNLALPQNRIAITSDAFPILWSRNEPQARSLVAQLIGDFAQAATGQEENPEPNSRQMLHQQWRNVLGVIAQSDAELALSFLNATRAFVQIGDLEQQEAEERSLRLELATQEAARNPRDALRLAEKDLQTPGDLPMELLNLLSQIAAKDPEAGTKLLHDIVGCLHGSSLTAGESNFNFALNLLNQEVNSSTNGTPPDETLKTLADAVASAALSADFPDGMLPMLQGSLPMFEQLAAGRVQALRQKVDRFIRTQNPQQQAWDQFNQAQASGDPNQLLAVAEQASADLRSSMYQQVAWTFANNGDLQRARQIVDKLADPFQREQVLQQAIRQSAWNAANQGQFAAARQLIQQITPDEDRAIMLAQLASNAANAKQETLAEEMLEEAGGLLVNRGVGSSTFAAQLQVAQAFAHVKPARAVPLLERSASQLEQVLAAAVEVDAFLPYQHSFESGELVLNNSFLCNALVRPYAEAAAQLAGSDFASARILADRLPLPEARLFAELAVARAALDDGNTPAVARVMYGGRFRPRMQY